MERLAIAYVFLLQDKQCPPQSWVYIEQHGIGLLSPRRGRCRKSYLHAQHRTHQTRPQGEFPSSNLKKEKTTTGPQKKVIVITHGHKPDRVGIRWFSPRLKVYYIPFIPIASSATLPNFFTSLPYLRTILLREHIQLVHAHASLSSMGHEGILHAHLMGIRTIFTDHSLFGFADAASILTNKLLAATLKNTDAVICVSHTG